MERSKLLEQLAEVEQQVSRDMELIAHQRKILAELNGGGVDTGAIQIMVTGLEQLLILHLQRREKLLARFLFRVEPCKGDKILIQKLADRVRVAAAPGTDNTQSKRAHLRQQLAATSEGDDQPLTEARYAIQ